jgi:hypothetical protein
MASKFHRDLSLAGVENEARKPRAVISAPEHPMPPKKHLEFPNIKRFKWQVALLLAVKCDH